MTSSITLALGVLTSLKQTALTSIRMVSSDCYKAVIFTRTFLHVFENYESFCRGSICKYNALQKRASACCVV